VVRRFHVEMIKPSHYDDDGYVIQWWRASVPSNSLASLYAIVLDAASRGVLGEGATISQDAWDECNTVIHPEHLARRIRAADGGGIVFLVGVQSNQYPRAMDIARSLRVQGIRVVIGGFHVSGCLSMLSEMPADLKEAVSLGITLFAGEAEGHIDELLGDAFANRLKPIYNFLKDLPNLDGAPSTYLPAERLRRYSPPIGSFDAGRGCPFQCSFCTIINVQGRKSRYRSADDVERLLRANLARGVYRFFITDDDFARNRNWEPILDRIIEMRESEGLYLRFIIQVDALAYRIPNFVEKCKRAGCLRVFIGLESVNAENLLQAKKRQNKVGGYRTMLQAWRAAGIMTFCGYILGFPGDSVASIERDIAAIQRELPLDILEFFILTPLPGSEDHKVLHERGAWMDGDMNKYDVEHVTTGHAQMSAEAWQDIYRRAWELYYSWAHIETLLRRAVADGIDARRLMLSIVQFRSIPLYEKVHPLQGGYLRRRIRKLRRPGLPKEAALRFYPRRAWETLATLGRTLAFLVRIDLVRRRVIRAAKRQAYSDQAIRSLPAEMQEALDLPEEVMAVNPAGPMRPVPGGGGSRRVLEGGLASPEI
jgi:radical SAM superfamily enzyme YgiQ (UPF0313 family)